MGTGVALWAMKNLFQNLTSKEMLYLIWKTILLNLLDLRKPSGLVLEAPFYNTLQGLVSYPLTRVSSMLLIEDG
jgi:hypothetical protein